MPAQYFRYADIYRQAIADARRVPRYAEFESRYGFHMPTLRLSRYRADAEISIEADICRDDFDTMSRRGAILRDYSR